MAKKKTKSNATGSKPSKKRAYVSQSDMPRHSLRVALTVAQAITDNYAGDPTSPHQVAIALNVSPTSSGWRSLAGAATAYGLTKGAYNSAKISLTDLGRRCTAPTEEGDDIQARAEAALKPGVPRQFFQKYNRSKFPPDQIAKNVLQQKMSVHADRVDEVLKVLKDDGAFVGFVHRTKTGPFVSIDDLSPTPVTVEADSSQTAADISDEREASAGVVASVATQGDLPPRPTAGTDGPFRVFITHGKNKKIVDQVKDVLDLYDIEYEIAVEEESPAIPVPQKVLTAMRKCQSGVIPSYSHSLANRARSWPSSRWSGQGDDKAAIMVVREAQRGPIGGLEESLRGLGCRVDTPRPHAPTERIAAELLGVRHGAAVGASRSAEAAP